MVAPVEAEGVQVEVAAAAPVVAVLGLVEEVVEALARVAQGVVAAAAPVEEVEEAPVEEVPAVEKAAVGAVESARHQCGIAS